MKNYNSSLSIDNKEGLFLDATKEVAVSLYTVCVDQKDYYIYAAESRKALEDALSTQTISEVSEIDLNVLTANDKEDAQLAIEDAEDFRKPTLAFNYVPQRVAA